MKQVVNDLKVSSLEYEEPIDNSELIESLFQEFKNMGFSKEEAEKLAHHTREIMEICNVSKSDAIRGIVEMLK